MSDALRIAVMHGDGIGPDIVEATVAVAQAALARVGGSVQWRPLPVGFAALAECNSTLPPSTIEGLEHCDGWLLGPVDHARYAAGDQRFVNPSGYLRKHYDLVANIRPVQSWAIAGRPAEPIDLVIVRENTEGMYADRNVLDGNGELRISEDVIVSMRVVTRRALQQLLQTAFDLAQNRPQRHLTIVHKANVLKRGDGLFLKIAREMSSRYPQVRVDDAHVDAFAMHLVMHPQTVDVVATTNMFGDILSDEAAGLVGGLGLAPGLNAGRDRAMAQAAHGSAPDIAETHAGNPTAEILSGAMLLEWLGRRRERPRLLEAAALMRQTLARHLQAGRSLTPDLGGDCTTAEMAAALRDAIALA